MTGNGTTGYGNTGSTRSETGNHAGHMGMQALQNATGTEFDRMWVSQMLGMHEAKLAELTAASNTVGDTELKSVISSAITKIRSHRDMLTRMNTGTGTNSSTNSNSKQ